MQLGFVPERLFDFEVDPDRNLDFGVLTLFLIVNLRKFSKSNYGSVRLDPNNRAGLRLSARIFNWALDH